MSAPAPNDDQVPEQDCANQSLQQLHAPPAPSGRFTIHYASAPQPQPPPVISAPEASPRQLAPPRKTDHTYHDYAQDHRSLLKFPLTKKCSSNFPAKLHAMISDPTNAEAIQWQPHGRAWKILNKAILVDEVIPKYFVQSKFESFTRQVCGWGFKRLYQTGPDHRCYYHECFLRGMPDLTRMMKRVEANLGKLVSNVKAEPDFYEMDRRQPLPLTPHSHPSDGGLHVNHDYQADAGEAAVGYPPQHYGPPPHWPPYPLYPYGHYPGHRMPPPPPDGPPPPYRHENFHHPPYPYHHNPHAYQMPPPYHGEYPAHAAAGMPPHPHPDYAPYPPRPAYGPRQPPDQYYNEEAAQPHPNHFDAYHNPHEEDDAKDDENNEHDVAHY